MKKQFLLIPALTLAILILFGSASAAAAEKPRDGVLDSEVAAALNGADGDAVFSVAVELDYQFDESSVPAPDDRDGEAWRSYRASLTEAASAFYTQRNAAFSEKIADFATVTDTDALTPIVRCDVTKENIYTLAGYEEVIRIFFEDLQPEAVEAPESKFDENALAAYEAAKDSDILSVGVEMDYQFDGASIPEPDEKDSEAWRAYRARLTEAASAFYTQRNAAFSEKIADIATVTGQDALTPIVWCDIAKADLDTLAGYDEVLRIFIETEPTPVEIYEEETTEPPCEDVSLAPLGDVNLDMKVTAADAREILRYAARLSNGVMNEENADVNADGKITAADARLALRMAARDLDIKYKY